MSQNQLTNICAEYHNTAAGYILFLSIPVQWRTQVKNLSALGVLFKAYRCIQINIHTETLHMNIKGLLRK